VGPGKRVAARVSRPSYCEAKGCWGKEIKIPKWGSMGNAPDARRGEPRDKGGDQEGLAWKGVKKKGISLATAPRAPIKDILEGKENQPQRKEYRRIPKRRIRMAPQGKEGEEANWGKDLGEETYSARLGRM